MDKNLEVLSKLECPEYLHEKEYALQEATELHYETFVKTMAMVFEASPNISGGRASELMNMIAHLLKCRKVCIKHRLMREVIGLTDPAVKS